MADLSRGAAKCLAKLKSYGARIFPKQSTLAGDMKCGLRTVNRYIQELKDGGFLEIDQRGPTSAFYKPSNQSHADTFGVASKKDDHSVENPVEINEIGVAFGVASAPASLLLSEGELERENQPIVETTPGLAYQQEFERHVKAAGGWSMLPAELVEKICARAGALEPSRAAAVFLQVYSQAMRRSDIRDGMAFLIGVFTQEIAKLAPLPRHKPPVRAEVGNESFQESIARLAERKRL